MAEDSGSNALDGPEVPAANAAQCPTAPLGPPPVRHVFACLVHESPECIADLVRNLRYLDPDSAVLLYNGGQNPHLLAGAGVRDQHNVVVHPAPRPMKWGRLHDFALDCMRFARVHLPFDALTIVDSDQLGLRVGYSAHLSAYLAQVPGVGMLSNSPERQGPGSTVHPARVAHAEIDLWRPFLRRFPDGEARFVHWGFWPATVFTADAARDLVELFDGDPELRQLMNKTQVWATEEVILPTLVALLGYRVAANPCSYDFVRYRMPYSVQQIEAAMDRADVFWAHPIPRRYDDPLRARVRNRFHHYAPPGTGPAAPPSTAHAAASAPPPFVLTLPILARMRMIEGWLADEEADLLIGATTRALAEHPECRAVVEVGSYCGRGTVVLGSVVKVLRPTARVWSIDPHDGKLGAVDRYVFVAPSLEKLRANLAAAGLTDVVEVVRASAPEVPWREVIGLLLIDGLHDHASVARDFSHFAPWIAEGGYVAFHDYADYYPGVVTFVNELLSRGDYRTVCIVRTLIVLQKEVRVADEAVAVAAP
jgi:hypothetical protein